MLYYKMGGGLMQLVAYGAQDIYLTGNPQITFFKVVYKRHTNFSMESIRATFDGNVDFGHELGFSFQHGLQVIDNGNIITLDNGNLSEAFLGTAFKTTRALEIQVSENAGTSTANIVWEYSLPEDLFGFASGNVQKLENYFAKRVQRK